MPGKRKAKTTPKPAVVHGSFFCEPEAAWGGFINVRLDDEQKAQFYTWIAENAKHVAGYIQDLLGEEAKLTLTYDLTNECFIVALAGALVGNSNERYVSSSRAGTLDEALQLTVWKHFILADGDYGNYRTNGSMMSWG